MSYDKIYIRDLLLRCIIGLNDDERRAKQDVIINIVLYTDLREPGRTDRIEDSVNYRIVKQEIIPLVEKSSYFLIEKLAEEIAAACLCHEHVQKVRITVDKPSALRFSRSVAVEIIRCKKSDGA